MNDALSVLNRVLEEHGQQWSVEDRQLVARIVSRATEFAAGVAAQANITDDEWAQLKAQVAAISAAEAHVVAAMVRTSVMELLTGAVGVVIKGIGILG